MTPQELKNSILQLAIQGKLVEQRPEDGTAEELLLQIQAEKQALIKAGKIKKGKLYPAISEEEIPFDIPDTWIMARLQDLVYNRGQEVPSETFCYIDIGSIDNKRQQLNAEDNVLEASKAPSRARKLVQSGDILYSTVRPYLHNMCIVDREFSHKPIASTGFATMTCFGGIYNKYLFYYLLSPIFDRYANDTENAKGVAYPAINDDRLYRAVIAIPPLKEQKRIVAKLEEILPLIDRYEVAWNKLEVFNKRFPGDMQKSILQLAIQGKLVEQRPEEGTGEELYKAILESKKKILKGKKEGKLSSENFKEEELLFDIPDSWKWVRFGHIMINKDAERIPLSVDERDKLSKIYDYYGASGVIDKVDRYLFDKILLLIGEDGANLLTRSTPIAFLATGKYWVNNHAHVLDCDENLLCMEYIMWFINAINLAPYVTGTAQPKMNQQKMNSIPIALPPLAEQKRIVAKLEEILPLCERLKTWCKR